MLKIKNYFSKEARESELLNKTQKLLNRVVQENVELREKQKDCDLLTVIESLSISLQEVLDHFSTLVRQKDEEIATLMQQNYHLKSSLKDKDCEISQHKCYVCDSTDSSKLSRFFTSSDMMSFENLISAKLKFICDNCSNLVNKDVNDEKDD